MNSTITLPDFDELFSLVEEIRELSLKKALIEYHLKLEEARILGEATSNPKYFVKGNPPSKSHVESTYFFTGFENELVSLREEVARLEPEIDAKKSKLRLLEKLTEVWRTQSANERGMTS